jgi:hypothetical protein
VEVNGDLRIPAALTSGVELTEVIEWMKVLAAELVCWPVFYLTRVGLKVLPKFCDVNYVIF